MHTFPRAEAGGMVSFLNDRFTGIIHCEYFSLPFRTSNNTTGGQLGAEAERPNISSRLQENEDPISGSDSDSAYCSDGAEDEPDIEYDSDGNETEPARPLHDITCEQNGRRYLKYGENSTRRCLTWLTISRMGYWGPVDDPPEFEKGHLQRLGYDCRRIICLSVS